MNMKLHLGSIATLVVGVGAHAYAQPVVPEDSTTCPNPQQASCPQDQSQAAPAQTPPPAEPVAQTPPPEPTYAPAPAEHHDDWYTHQLAFSVGGGVDAFSQSNATRLTDVGGGWNARLTIGTRSFIAGEVSYIGSAQSVENAVGFNNNTTLYGNGAQAALRLNALATYWLQPFAYGGAAWRHYSLSQGSGNSDVLEIPVGIGFATYINELMLDVRGEYRFAVADSTSNDLGLNFSDNNSASDFDRWGVTGNLGYVF